MAFHPAQLQTAGDIISDVASELGLGTVSDAYGSADVNVVQLRGLLKSVGRRLVREYTWSHLVQVLEIDASGGELSDYPVNDDWLEIVDGTFWDRTANRPILPASNQEWEAMEAADVSGLSTIYFRQVMSDLHFLPSIPEGTLAACRYRSYWWAAAGAGASPSIEYPTANASYVFFEPNLIVSALKLEFLKAKGFDTAHAQREYDDALSKAIAGDTPARTHNLAGARPLGDFNVPDTGFGS